MLLELAEVVVDLGNYNALAFNSITLGRNVITNTSIHNNCGGFIYFTALLCGLDF